MGNPCPIAVGELTVELRIIPRSVAHATTLAARLQNLDHLKVLESYLEEQVREETGVILSKENLELTLAPTPAPRLKPSAAAPAAPGEDDGNETNPEKKILY